MQSIIRKTNRKGSRKVQNYNRIKTIEQNLTLIEMFERFMSYKQTEGLAKPTIQCYYEHFRYLTEFVGGDIINENVTVELFRDYSGFMLNVYIKMPSSIRTKEAITRAQDIKSY